MCAPQGELAPSEWEADRHPRFSSVPASLSTSFSSSSSNYHHLFFPVSLRPPLFLQLLSCHRKKTSTFSNWIFNEGKNLAPFLCMCFMYTWSLSILSCCVLQGCSAWAQILIITFIVCSHAIMVQESSPCVCLLGLSTVTSVEQSIMFASPRRAGQKRRVDRSWLGLKGKYQPNFCYSWATKDISGSGFGTATPWPEALNSDVMCRHFLSDCFISRKGFWCQKILLKKMQSTAGVIASWSLARGGSETVNPCLRWQSGQLSLSHLGPCSWRKAPNGTEIRQRGLCRVVRLAPLQLNF